MKKALLVSLCFIVMGLVMLNGTFAGDFSEAISSVFADLSDTLGAVFGAPQAGEGTVDVKLVSDESASALFPGGEASRFFRVENAGTGDVYFRLAYAVQYDAETWENLHINFDAENGFSTHEGWKNITVSGTPYKMKVFTYNGVLPAGTTSPEVTISIAMDSSVTSEDMVRYRSDFLQTQALAIDPTPFIEKNYSVVQALDAALPLDTLNPF